MSSQAKDEAAAGTPARLEPPVTRRTLKATPRRLRNILALDDFEVAARRHLPRPIFGYVSGACETGASFAANRAAFTTHASYRARFGT